MARLDEPAVGDQQRSAETQFPSDIPQSCDRA
jgi:hypothetical protein